MKKYSVILLAVLVFGFSSCTKDFEEINKNPNAPTASSPELVLTNTLWNVANNNTRYGFDYGSVIAQMTAKRDFNQIDRYDLGSNGVQWNSSFTALRDMDEIIASSNNGLSGAAMIMKAYIGAQLTDLYGPVPFFEAGKGESGQFKPAYDSQEAIYTKTNGVIDLLKNGVAKLKKANGNISGDIVFGGSPQSWVRFGNALLVHYLVRISAVYPNAATELKAVVAANELMTSNTDNAVVNYLSQPHNWYLSNVRDSDFKTFKMTTTAKEIFEAHQDTRIEWFFAKNDQNKFEGLTPGKQPTADETKVISNLGANMRASNKMKAILMTYHMQQFDLAEAAQKGLIPGTSKDYYDKAVTASYGYLGVTLPADYLTDTSKGAFKAAEAIKSIITQKWMANVFNGYEAWYDYRRTGFPVLKPAVSNINQDRIPVRFIYPSEEEFTNKSNYQAAIAQLGANDINAKSWWDKK